MDAEARPFVEHLQLQPIEGFFPSQTPFLAFSGMHSGVQVTVITFGKDKVYGTGVDNAGTVPASLATFLALQICHSASSSSSSSSSSTSSYPNVDLVINAGTCGGFGRKGAAIGHVFLTTGVAHHDRRIPIPGFDTYGIGKLTTLDPTNMATALGYQTGICTTGNSLDKVEKDDEIMLENDASVKDMEAAGIAWVCAMNQVPYLGVKVVTDIVDGGIPTQDEFLANLHTAAVSLQHALPKVLDYVCDKTHDEL